MCIRDRHTISVFDNSLFQFSTTHNCSFRQHTISLFDNIQFQFTTTQFQFSTTHNLSFGQQTISVFDNTDFTQFQFSTTHNFFSFRQHTILVFKEQQNTTSVCFLLRQFSLLNTANFSWQQTISVPREVTKTDDFCSLFCINNTQFHFCRSSHAIQKYTNVNSMQCIAFPHWRQKRHTITVNKKGVYPHTFPFSVDHAVFTIKVSKDKNQHGGQGSQLFCSAANKLIPWVRDLVWGNFK